MIRLWIVLCVLLGGCATLREADPKSVDAVLGRLKAAKTVRETVSPTEDLRDLYYAQIGKLKGDILESGDQTTNLGILAGIVAASTGVSGDVLKGIGVVGASIGVYDLRYKPAQQRQTYLDAAQALGCIADHERQFGADLEGLRGAAAVQELARTAAGPLQLMAAKDVEDAPEITWRQVVAVHRRLSDKLFGVVSTQSVGAIRDSLIKDAVDAGKRADALRSQAPPKQVQEALARSESLSVETDAARVAVLQTQFARVLATATTYKTDLATCAADFLK